MFGENDVVGGCFIFFCRLAIGCVVVGVILGIVVGVLHQ